VKLASTDRDPALSVVKGGFLFFEADCSRCRAPDVAVVEMNGHAYCSWCLERQGAARALVETWPSLKRAFRAAQAHFRQRWVALDELASRPATVTPSLDDNWGGLAYG
jgi:hypothetical protein